jgi:hypothetical protein
MIKTNLLTRSVFRFTILALLAAAVVLLPVTLRADTVTYDLSPTDTLATGSITGSFTVNSATQLVNGTLIADGKTFTCNNCALISPSGNTSLEGFVALGPGGSFIVLGWSKLPADPNPLDFNSGVSYCSGCLSTLDFVSAGDFATVPEPSTALLLISGFAALPFVRRRRANI